LDCPGQWSRGSERDRVSKRSIGSKVAEVACGKRAARGAEGT